jgi:hypothetical protein
MIPKQQLKKIKTFLTENTKHVGFAGYNIDLIDKSDENSDKAAATLIYDGAHVLQVTLYQGWDTEPYRNWQNILWHELLHARVGKAFDDYLESTQQIRYQFEEQAVCDITKGFEQLNKRK